MYSLLIPRATMNTSANSYSAISTKSQISNLQSPSSPHMVIWIIYGEPNGQRKLGRLLFGCTKRTSRWLPPCNNNTNSSVSAAPPSPFLSKKSPASNRQSQISNLKFPSSTLRGTPPAPSAFTSPSHPLTPSPTHPLTLSSSPATLFSEWAMVAPTFRAETCPNSSLRSNISLPSHPTPSFTPDMVIQPPSPPKPDR